MNKHLIEKLNEKETIKLAHIINEILLRKQEELPHNAGLSDYYDLYEPISLMNEINETTEFSIKSIGELEDFVNHYETQDYKGDYHNPLIVDLPQAYCDAMEVD